VAAVLKEHISAPDTCNLSPRTAREQGGYPERDNSVGNSLLKRVGWQLLDLGGVRLTGKSKRLNQSILKNICARCISSGSDT